MQALMWLQFLFLNEKVSFELFYLKMADKEQGLYVINHYPSGYFLIYIWLQDSNIVYLIHLQYKIYITKFSFDLSLSGSTCAATWISGSLFNPRII